MLRLPLPRARCAVSGFAVVGGWLATDSPPIVCRPRWERLCRPEQRSARRAANHFGCALASSSISGQWAGAGSEFARR
eukprot:5786707-Alexandrium_andersonii.AAC.1